MQPPAGMFPQSKPPFFNLNFSNSTIFCAVICKQLHHLMESSLVCGLNFSHSQLAKVNHLTFSPASAEMGMVPLDCTLAR